MNYIYENLFRTRDVNLATVLYSENCKLDSTERINNKTYFVFEDENKCNEINRKFLRGELSINPQVFLTSQKILKNLIFNN